MDNCLATISAEIPMEEDTPLLSHRKAHTIKRWLGTRHSSLQLSLYVVAYFSYLVVGCLLFIYLEKETEEEIKMVIQRRKTDFLNDNPGVYEEELETFIEDIINLGVSPLKKDKANPNWSFGQSFLFTVTIVNTIGYGHVSPITDGGKVFCIVYAVCGIPASIMFISAVVQRVVGPTINMLSFISRGLSDLKVLPFFIKFTRFSLRIAPDLKALYFTLRL